MFGMNPKDKEKPLSPGLQEELEDFNSTTNLAAFIYIFGFALFIYFLYSQGQQNLREQADKQALIRVFGEKKTPQ